MIIFTPLSLLVEHFFCLFGLIAIGITWAAASVDYPFIGSDYTASATWVVLVGRVSLEAQILPGARRKPGSDPVGSRRVVPDTAPSLATDLRLQVPDTVSAVAGTADAVPFCGSDTTCSSVSAGDPSPEYARECGA